MQRDYNRALISLSLAHLLLLTAARPQFGADDKVGTSGTSDAGSIDLPFLQFKNGGIRVNFAGYHAEAGLGGLLGGSDAKGGLYASAGTPWGPSASAGLGGALGGQDGTARGGLHARAGLGNGRPEARAGLGGSLDGSARSGGRASGGLYAGADAGGPGAAAGLGGSVDGADVPGGNTGIAFADSTNGRKYKGVVKTVNHVQSIRSTREKENSKKNGKKEVSTTVESQPPTLNDRNEVASGLVAREIGNPGPKFETGANGVDGSDARDIVDTPFRRSYRKRYRNTPLRQSLYKFFTTNTAPQLAAGELPAASALSQVEGGYVADEKQDVNTTSNANVPANYPANVPANYPANVPANYPAHVPPNVPAYGVVPTYVRRPTLFDDIFNIPISTLVAVNQLLNNKAG